jgi:hypothetical protein
MIMGVEYGPAPLSLILVLGAAAIALVLVEMGHPRYQDV